jgi:hypothetical protein
VHYIFVYLLGFFPMCKRPEREAGNSPQSSKFRSRTDHEGPEGEYKYSSTLSLTSELDGSGWLTPRPGRFTPETETQYPLYRDWVRPGPVWTGVEIFALTGLRSPDRLARSESLHRLGYRGPRLRLLPKWGTGRACRERTLFFLIIIFLAYTYICFNTQ